MNRKRKSSDTGKLLSPKKNTKLSVKTIFELFEKQNAVLLKENIESEGVDLKTIRDALGETLLHRCVRKCINSTEMSKYNGKFNYLLLQSPELCMMKNNDGDTPLTLACKLMPPVKLFKRLVEVEERAVNVADSEGRTPLLIVSHNLGSMQEKYQLKLDLVRKSTEAKTIIQFLLQNDANINIEDNLGYNVIQLLLKPRSGLKNEPLKSDPNLEQINIALSLLLQKGAKAYSKCGHNAFLYVSCIESAKLLVQYNHKEINIVTNGLTPFDEIMNIVPKCESVKNEILLCFLCNGAISNLGKNSIKLAHENQCSFEIIEKLLKLYPNYDVNQLNHNDKESLLTTYGVTIENIRLLQKLGGNFSSITDVSYYQKLLTIASEKKDCDLLKLIINKKLNSNIEIPISKDTFKCIISECCCNTGPEFTKWFQLLKSYINLPNIKNCTDTIVLKHVYKFVFNQLFLNDKKINGKNNTLEIFTEIFKSNSNLNGIYFKSKPFMVRDYRMWIHKRELLTNVMNVIARSPNVNYHNLQIFLNFVLEHGYSVNNTHTDCITPLTLVMSLYRRQLNKEMHLSIVNKLIDAGVNIESCILQIANIGYFGSSESSNDSLGGAFDDFAFSSSNLKKETLLPDVLFIALVLEHRQYIELFLHHWWGPPLALIAFILQPRERRLKNLWFPMLLKYGGIPHGTKLFFECKDNIENYADEESENYDETAFQKQYEKFEELIASPLSLQMLCKYAVRHVYAKQAVVSNISLPTLLQQNMPPLLRSVVLLN